MNRRGASAAGGFPDRGDWRRAEDAERVKKRG